MGSDFQQIAASILSSSATAYAGLAASRLIERHPDVARPFGTEAMSTWKAHLAVRVQELAVATEFGIPAVMRSTTEWTRRSFEARDVSSDALRVSLSCLREVLLEELPEPERAKPVEYVDTAIRSLDQSHPTNGNLAGNTANDRVALAYIEACLSGDPRRAMQIVLEAADSGQAIQSIYFDILAPAQQEVGQLWHAAKIGVHEEHLVTSTTSSLLSILAHRNTPQEANGKTVVGAAIGNEGHDLGVRMIMDFFTMNGWNSICLGGHVPSIDLPRATVDFGADLLVLSVTLVTNLRFLRSAVAEVREANPSTKILVGGQAFVDAHEVWRAVGADAIAKDAHDAVSRGASLVGIESS